jgi:asparaginyl-tRNA synthetase
MQQTIQEQASKGHLNAALTGIRPTHERVRDPFFIAVARIQGALLEGARQYFDQQGWTEVPTPHLTRATGACENIDTMYEIDHEGKAFLSQTGQLYLESLLSKDIPGVWTAGPSFRKEEKDDGRHSSEFTLIEFEHVGDFDLLLEHIEGTVLSMVRCALRTAPNDLAQVGADMAALKALKAPFIKVRYEDLLEQHGLAFGDDIPSSVERDLTTKGFPVFITHYPVEIKFFNMRNNPEDQRVVNSADLILPHGGEAVGSAERINEAEMLREKLATSRMMDQLRRKGVGTNAFQWYIDCVAKNKPALHSGCGIGLGRVMQYVMACNDIRRTTPFPVTPKNIE